MGTPVSSNQQRLANINAVRTVDAISKIFRERWMIGTDSEKGSGNSVQSARLEDDYDD